MAQSPGDFTLSAAPDAELVKHIQKRDQFAEEAIRVLYNRHSKELWRIIFSITQDYHGSEDLVQVFFLRFWARKSAEPVENFVRYLHGSVKNLVSDYYRSSLKKSRDLALYLETDEGDIIEAPYLPSIPSAEEIAYLNELLRHAIDSLSDLDRQCLILYTQKITSEDIGKILNMTAKQVSKHICSARKRIRAYMHQ